jgi:hypothetical protein
MNNDEVPESVETELAEELNEEDDSDSQPEQVSPPVQEKFEFKFRPVISEDPRQKLINKIFAAGANSYCKAYSVSEQEVFKEFLKLDFELISPTWTFLNSDVQFKIFSQHVDEFQAFLLSKGKEKK